MNRLPVRLPTATARRDLDRWTRAGQTAWDQRARTLLLAAASGACGPERTQLLGLHPQTTRRWLHAFSTAGLTALAPRPAAAGAGRWTTTSPRGSARSGTSPPAQGAEADRGTLRDVAAVLVRAGDVRQSSRERLRRLLQSRKHSGQRAKEGLRCPDPQDAFKNGGALAA